jgi:trk system potassium uptake protein TrkA
MKAIVIGCGRVGSNVAKALHRHGWEVTVVDERDEALSRLGKNWAGRFVKGHGMDVGVLREAGIDSDDPPVAVVVATDGDNTNIIIGQVAQKRFDIPTVVVRLLDPARAEFYAARGLRVVCPTSNAISVLTDAVRQAAPRPRERAVS